MHATVRENGVGAQDSCEEDNIMSARCTHSLKWALGQAC